MGKVRTSALVNGLLIGVALGAFGAGLLGRYFFYHLAEEHLAVWLPLYPDSTELLMHVESLKATGNEILLISIIAGIVLLALGIGNEVYQRAKRHDS